MKAILKNNSKDVVPLRLPFSSGPGALHIEVAPPTSSDEFRRVQAIGEGRECLFVPEPIKFRPGATLASYERLFWDRGTAAPVFSRAGKWRLRAVTTVTGQPIVSPPVTVEVIARDKPALDLLIKCAEPLHRTLYYTGFAQDEDRTALLGARKELGDSNVSRVITAAECLSNLHGAVTPREHVQALAELNKLRAQLPPVSQEYLDLRAASILITHREFESAERLLERVKEPSTQREELWTQLRERRDGPTK